eukprot:15447383-Alexandrium_andersonii.AAC.1
MPGGQARPQRPQAKAGAQRAPGGHRPTPGETPKRHPGGAHPKPGPQDPGREHHGGLAPPRTEPDGGAQGEEGQLARNCLAERRAPTIAPWPREQ